jgi:hypothetical protein
MKNKKLIIAIAVVAVIAVAWYFHKKKNSEG